METEGYYFYRFGEPETLTPTKFAPPRKLQPAEGAPAKFPANACGFTLLKRGCRVQIPIGPEEEIYGFGLQLKGFACRGQKKALRPNADPVANSGDSHAPVPFIVSTGGYGIYIDTARYAEISCGVQRNDAAVAKQADQGVMTDVNELYRIREAVGVSDLILDIPAAKGIDLYVFEGQTITDIVAQYNLFSGGGCLPPYWGLGILYRCNAGWSAGDILQFAKGLREDAIPCDTIGLEPGWHTRSYSCSFVWSPERFPDPEGFLREMQREHFHVNLWEHAFTHPESPIHDALRPYSGDYLVWGGLVPDFSLREAREIFGGHHKQLIAQGVSGFKLDECDGSDYTGSWSFPNSTLFPSGLEGDQMHSLFGTLYMQTLMEALGAQGTLSEVRNAGALAASYPFVLYSDLYAHSDFIRGLCTAGFSGLLWAPEVRDAASKEDLIRRVQSVIFSPQAIINAWYCGQAPWVDWDAKAEIQRLFQLRMQLLPYLYTAFYRYATEGVAPVRAVVSDYTYDREVRGIDDAYLFGDAMLVAPLLAGQKERKVYLPAGEWYDFWTKEKVAAGWHTVATENIPVYVKSGTMLPLAKPVPFVGDETVFALRFECYGPAGGCRLADDIEERLLEVSFECGKVNWPGDSKRYHCEEVEFF